MENDKRASGGVYRNEINRGQSFVLVKFSLDKTETERKNVDKFTNATTLIFCNEKQK